MVKVWVGRGGGGCARWMNGPVLQSVPGGCFVTKQNAWHVCCDNRCWGKGVCWVGPSTGSGALAGARQKLMVAHRPGRKVLRSAALSLTRRVPTRSG